MVQHTYMCTSAKAWGDYLPSTTKCERYTFDNDTRMLVTSVASNLRCENAALRYKRQERMNEYWVRNTAQSSAVLLISGYGGQCLSDSCM